MYGKEPNLVLYTVGRVITDLGVSYATVRKLVAEHDITPRMRVDDVDYYDAQTLSVCVCYSNRKELMMGLLDLIRQKREQQEAEQQAGLVDLALKEAQGKATKADADRLAKLVGEDEAQAERYSSILAECQQLIAYEQNAAALDGADAALAEGRTRIVAQQAEVEQIITDAQQEQRDLRAELERLRDAAHRQKQADTQAQAIRERLAVERGDVDAWEGRNLGTAVLFPDGEQHPRGADLDCQPSQGPHLAVPEHVYAREMDRRRALVAEARESFDAELNRLLSENPDRQPSPIVAELNYATVNNPRFDALSMARQCVTDPTTLAPAQPKGKRNYSPTG